MRTARSCWLVGLAALAAGCSSGNGSSPPTEGLAVAEQPIAECVAYEQAFARCNRVEGAPFDRPRMQAMTKPERERLQRLCAANLDRLNHACR